MNIVLWILQWVMAVPTALMGVIGLFRGSQGFAAPGDNQAHWAMVVGYGQGTNWRDQVHGLFRLTCATGLVLPAFDVTWSFLPWVVPIAAGLLIIETIWLLKTEPPVPSFEDVSGPGLEITIIVILSIIAILRIWPYRF